jgi:hypothetical protein
MRHLAHSFQKPRAIEIADEFARTMRKPMTVVRELGTPWPDGTGDPDEYIVIDSRDVREDDLVVHTTGCRGGA